MQKPQKQKIFQTAKKPRIIVISGPTATGKTDLSISMAKIIGGEIISADSMQVYRGMDIGTAKATYEQRLSVPIIMEMDSVLDFKKSFDFLNEKIF